MDDVIAVVLDNRCTIKVVNGSISWKKKWEWKYFQWSRLTINGWIMSLANTRLVVFTKWKAFVSMVCQLVVKNHLPQGHQCPQRLEWSCTFFSLTTPVWQHNPFSHNLLLCFTVYNVIIATWSSYFFLVSHKCHKCWTMWAYESEFN